MQPVWEVADVLHKLGKEIESIGLNTWQLRTLSAIKKCRTAALGGHIDACDTCGTVRISYNSCRNRHCPKCQGKNREQWIEKRGEELLPVPYFHVVFTLPDSIHALAIHQAKMVYDMLFASAWETLNTFGKNSGIKAGMIAVLHTWGQTLGLHPHLHCIVPGGGIDKHGRFKTIRTDGKFLYPVKALSKVFRAKYCEKLRAANPQNYYPIKQALWAKEWVVYAKRPFGNAKSVVEYLGRYTHKIAISNHRLKQLTDTEVVFEYKDYKTGAQKKQMALTHQEFIRRFALHILPKRFVKIRHYGFLSSTWKRGKLKLLQEKMGIKLIKVEPKTKGIILCPCCKKGMLHTILTFDKRGPPALLHGSAKTIVRYEN